MKIRIALELEAKITRGGASDTSETGEQISAREHVFRVACRCFGIDLGPSIAQSFDVLDTPTQLLCAEIWERVKAQKRKAEAGRQRDQQEETAAA